MYLKFKSQFKHNVDHENNIKVNDHKSDAMCYLNNLKSSIIK